MTRTSELRLVRVMAALIGVGALLFGWLAIGAIAREDDLMPAWWAVIAALAVFGAPVVAAIVVWRSGLVVARVALGTVAALHLAAAIGTLRVAYPSPWPDAVWVLNNTALGTSAAALALTPAAAWSYSYLLAMLVALERSWAEGGGVLDGVQHGLYSFAFSAVFIALAQLVLTRARRLDEDTAAAARHAAAVEAAHARQAERTLVDALLHDTVLATLMLASRGGDRVDPELRRQAAAAVAALDDRPRLTEDQEVELVPLLRSRLARLDPRIPVHLPAARPTLPQVAAEALTDAAIEAARNSLRHARLAPGSAPVVRLEHRDGRSVITVEDDGCGFDPDSIPEDRLGLRSSVLGRLAALAGTTARIESAPGAGTRVTLIWQPA